MPSAPSLRTSVLLRSEETGGHVSVTEIVVPPHTAGPPLHRRDFDEASYMLEGALIFQVRTLDPGGPTVRLNRPFPTQAARHAA
jgi:hypothetical protein